MKGKIHTGCVVFLLVAAGCSHMAERRFVSRFEDETAPDFELTALNGGTVTLSALQGKPVVLSFFAHG